MGVLHLYRHQLENNIIPSLDMALDKYSEFWSFKTDSPLQLYLTSVRDRPLEPYFVPLELIDHIIDEAHKLKLFAPGNSKIIVANQSLTNCFRTKLIYTPDLYQLCLPHVNVVSNAIKLKELKHNHVYNELYVNPATDIVYKDPAAKFWIPPYFNAIVCKNAKITYTWDELLNLFSTFIHTRNNHINPIHPNSLLFAINPHSVFTQDFQFKIFHTNQLDFILKSISKYLGKQSTVLSLCPKLKSILDQNDSVVLWIESILFHNNRLMPIIPRISYL